MERVKHASLVPQWVRVLLVLGNPAGYALPRRNLEGLRLAFAVGMITWALIFSGYFIALVLAPQVMSLGVGWTFLVPALLSSGLLVARRIAYGWIRKTWSRATGDADIDRYLYLTEGSIGYVREILRRLALRIHAGQVSPADFHVARDIAALHWLCDENLRIRDLVRS